MFWSAAETVRCLVDRHSYLPFAAVDVLGHIKFTCDLDTIMEEAVRTLTSTDSDAEALRRAIHAIASTGGLHDKDLYIVSRAPSDALPASKAGRKNRLRLLARLALLNFAAVPLEYLTILAGMPGAERSSPVAVPTIAAVALLARGLAGEEPWSPMPEDAARLVVSFGFELRREIVRWLLERHPRTAGDIVAPVYVWLEKELEWRRPEWSRLREYRGFIRGPLQLHVLREALLAPYYLQHYGFLELDPIMYMLMWEVGRW